MTLWTGFKSTALSIDDTKSAQTKKTITALDKYRRLAYLSVKVTTLTNVKKYNKRNREDVEISFGESCSITVSLPLFCNVSVAKLKFSNASAVELKFVCLFNN